MGGVVVAMVIRAFLFAPLFARSLVCSGGILLHHSNCGGGGGVRVFVCVRVFVRFVRSCVFVCSCVRAFYLYLYIYIYISIGRHIPVCVCV